MIKKLIFVFLLLLFIVLPSKVFANDNSYVTIVNPVRISSYIKYSEKSLSAEYSEIKNRNLPATWLFTYDALKNPDVLKVIKSFDDNQEKGIFLEVTPPFAKDANVIFNARDSWHRATSLFLSGYTQEDRKKIIDKVFSEFKKVFGYYPKSVGSWWTDSYSLDYISKKYGVTSNLSVSDQFTLDGYHVWGTPWSTPYYASKINAAIPAKNKNDSANVLMLRWAPRDPVNGFESPNSKISSGMYSTQDYKTINLPNEYFKNLSSFYAIRSPQNKFGHLIVGLESDFSENTFLNSYATMLDNVLSVSNSGGAQILSMNDFTNWYRNAFKDISPPQLLIADDFLGSSKKAFWFQNSNYRMGLLYDEKDNSLKVRDFKLYQTNIEEPFLIAPNRQNDLYILIPYLIDSAIEPESSWDLDCGKYINNIKEGSNNLDFEKCNIDFQNDSIVISGVKNIPDSLKDNQNVKVEKSGNFLIIRPQKLSKIGKDGITIEKIGLKVPYGILRRIPLSLIDLLPIIVFVTLLSFGILLFKYSKRLGKWGRVAGIISVVLVFIALLSSRQLLYVSQVEMDALNFLKKMPQGRVLVFDKDCLRCSWVTTHEPAAMAGFKDYITKYSNKKVIESIKLPLSKSPQDIKDEIRSKKVKYVYLTKYEDNVEELPYPGDQDGLVKIYENANVQIWKVVE